MVTRGKGPPRPAVSTARAAEREIERKACQDRCRRAIYTSVIDRRIAFYRGRIYLADSPFRILGDIGRDAAKRIHWLKRHRAGLVAEMAEKRIKPDESRISVYLNVRMRGW